MKTIAIAWLLAACGDNNVLPTTSDAAQDAPASVDLPDLRFKWVGAFASYDADQLSNLLPSMTQTLEGEFAWSPFQLGGGDSWEKYRFTPTVKTPTFTSVAQADDVARASADLDKLQSSNMIVSLDFTPTSYAVIVQGTPEIASRHTVVRSTAPLSKVAETVAARAADGFITTALAAQGANVHLIGYRATGDTTVYETAVETAELATLEARAITLGAAGFVITAFGRSADATYVLVGTRVVDATTPRDTLALKLGDDSVTDKLGDGYAIVGIAFVPEQDGRGVILQR